MNKLTNVVVSVGISEVVNAVMIVAETVGIPEAVNAEILEPETGVTTAVEIAAMIVVRDGVLMIKETIQTKTRDKT